MEWHQIGKWAAGFLIMGSVFGLVIVGRVDPGIYLNLATGVLAGLGIIAVGKGPQ